MADPQVCLVFVNQDVVVVSGLRGGVVANMSELESNTLPGRPIYLSTLTPTSRTSTPQTDRNAAGGALDLGGLAFQRGLGVRGTAELAYRLAENFTRFEAWAGLDSASPRGRASFEVFTDGELGFDSGPMEHVTQGDTVNAGRPVGVKVALAGVSELRLVVRELDGGAGSVMADWGDAKLIRPAAARPHPAPLPSRDALAPTPPMGWNSWNNFSAEIDEQLIREMTDALVDSGMKDAGYQYVCLDDGWQGRRGDLWNEARFPNGMKAIGDYIHSRGLSFGIYTRPEWVRGEEEQVAAAFARWGVDYLKYDFSDVDAEETNRRMIAAIRQTGRPIVFNICEWGKNHPWEWGAGIDGQSWRVAYDVIDMWDAPRDDNRGLGFMRAVDQTEALGRFQTPGRWNDPDMLVVGLNGNGFLKGGGCSATEYRTHFGLWCLLSAPLLAACDLRNKDQETKAILTNPEVIALDQDPLGIPAWRAKKLADLEVWQKPLHNGDIAVGLLNRGDRPATTSARWRDLFISGKYHARDLWTMSDLGVHDQVIEQRVASHEMMMLRLSPVS